MKISPAGLAFIQDFEGYHRKLPDGGCAAYRCQIGNGMDDGKWTIGFGCTEGITASTIWTRAQADEAFLRELSRFEAAVTRLVTVPMNQHQYDALVSFAYNCGEGALAKSTLLRKFNAGDSEGAAQAFGSWTKSRGIVVSGLVRRRAAEAAMFREPAAISSEPDMPQTVDEPEPLGSGEMHFEMHHAMQESSWVYSAQNWCRKKLGLPVAGGAAGVSLLDDPMSTLGGVVQFAQAYGLRIVAVAVVVLLVVEGAAAIARQKAIEASQ